MCVLWKDFRDFQPASLLSVPQPWIRSFNFKKIYKPMRNIRPWVMALTAVDPPGVTKSEWEAELPQFWREEHLKPPTKRSCDLSGSDSALSLSLSLFWSDQRSELSPCTLLFASSPTHTHTHCTTHTSESIRWHRYLISAASALFQPSPTHCTLLYAVCV